MLKKLERGIISTCPSLYKGIHLPPEKCYMHKGFECGNGWHEILQETSNELEIFLKTLPKKERRSNYAMHVISKNGCLRIYMSLINETIEKILSKLVSKSLIVCEVCGEEGFRKHNRTRCTQHHSFHNARQSK